MKIQASLFLIPGLVSLGLTGCASQPGTPEYQQDLAEERYDNRVDQLEATLDDLPDWYLKPPSDDYHLYGVASATSEDLQLAIDKAQIDARRMIAEKLDARISGKLKHYAEETGNLDAMDSYSEQASKVIQSIFTEVNLRGYQIEKQTLLQEGTRYRSYALVSFPLGEANQLMMNKMREDQKLNNVLTAAKAYQDLEAEIQAARHSKVQAAPAQP